MMASDNGNDRLDLHDFLFLSSEGGIDLVNGLIGRLLHFRLLVLFVVLADRVLLPELLKEVEAVAAHVPPPDPRVLAIFVRDLDHFLAPLLVQFWNADAEDRALDGR